MKREELTALGIEGETLEKVMSLYGRDVEKHKTIAKEWEQKYNEDTQNLQTQLHTQTYSALAEKAMQNLQFTSVSAKTAFCDSLQKAGLPVNEGELTGFDVFLEQYQQQDSEAFKQPLQEKAPVFMHPTQQADENAYTTSLRAAFGL